MASSRLPLANKSDLRSRLSGAIELLIDVLDRMDGDPDLEDDSTMEAEPLEMDAVPFAPNRATKRQRR